MASKLRIRINNRQHTVAAAPDTPLLYVLTNELALRGPRFGCGLAQCGSCSVLVDGKEQRSCVTPVSAVAGKSITTLEGLPGWYATQRKLAHTPELHPLQQALIDEQAFQCGYCCERHDRESGRAARAESGAERRRDSHCDERPPLPLRHVPADSGRDQTRGARDAGALRVSAALDRRDFLKAGGALVVGFGLGVRLTPAHGAPPPRGATAGPPDPKLIDTWLAIHADNTATLYIGFVELGQGTTTALPQIAAEELDLTLDQIRTVQTDTNVTPNQGGTYSSASIARGGPQVRSAAAEARQALLKLASERLGVSASDLRVAAGVVTAAGSSRRVTYGELIGDKLFEIPFTGNAPVKAPADYKLVGGRAPRKDLPAKVAGTFTYVQHQRLPGMLHGRVVRPRGQRAYGVGAKIVSIDDSSIRGIAGARVLRKGDFVGVVAPTEWDAVRAARDLKVVWDDAPSLPAFENLYAHMRAAPTTDTVVLEAGNAADAFDRAAHRVTFSAHCPYQAHATFAPNCALADVKADSALVMCSSQDIYNVRRALAPLLGLAEQQIRVQFCDGAGTYGHSCYDDVTQAAALLSQLAHAPVRVQFMRADEHGWDPLRPRARRRGPRGRRRHAARSSRTSTTAGTTTGAWSRRRSSSRWARRRTSGPTSCRNRSARRTAARCT